MKFNICSCCGEIVFGNAYTCKNCGSCYCQNCGKFAKSVCNCCGQNLHN